MFVDYIVAGSKTRQEDGGRERQRSAYQQTSRLMKRERRTTTILIWPPIDGAAYVVQQRLLKLSAGGKGLFPEDTSSAQYPHEIVQQQQPIHRINLPIQFSDLDRTRPD